MKTHLNQNQLTKKIIEKFILHETLIQKNVKVIEHSNPRFVSVSGEIVKETKNTMTISSTSNDTLLTIEKKSGKFEFHLKQHKVIIDGKLLLNLDNKRKKKKIRNW